MKLNAAQLDRVKNWFDTKGVHQVCAACGGNEVSVNFFLASDLIDPQSGERTGNMYYLPVICKNCCHVMLFAAMGLGLIGTTEEEVPADDET